MERKSLFEKMKERKIVYIDEIIKIKNIISYFPTEFEFKKIYKMSKLNYLGADMYEAYASIIEIDSFDNIESEYYLSHMKAGDITLDKFLDVIEFTKNVFIANVGNVRLVKQLDNLLENIISVIGYTFKLNSDDDYILILKNPIAEAVSLVVNEDVRDKIYSYLSLRNGDKDGKRVVLKSMSDNIELLREKYRGDNFIEKVGRVMQCVRHPKAKKIETDSYFFKNEEKSMDELFNMFICVLSSVKVKEAMEKWNIK